MNQTAQDPIASQAPEAPPRPVLDYPFEAPPQRGQTLEVAAGERKRVGEGESGVVSGGLGGGGGRDRRSIL